MSESTTGPRSIGGRQRRLAVTTLTALSLVAVAAGCGRGGDATGSAEAPPKVAFVQAHMTSSFRTQMIEGAEAAAEELGVDLTVFNSNNEIIKQNEAIDSYAAQGFDVIIVAAIELESSLPAIRAAAEDGAKIIAVDTIIPDDAVSSQVGVDNAAGGRDMGNFVVEYANENSIDLRIGTVGALNSEIQNTRADSFAEVITEAGGEIVQTVDGQNRQELAIASAENLLTTYQDLPIIYATGEPALVGTLAAATSQGADSTLLFGWDLSQDSVNAIEDGTVIAVAHQPAAQEGRTAIETAVALHNGEDVPRDQLIPVEIVTAENLDEYRGIFE